MISYQIQRVNFERIVKAYKSYLVLYRYFNHGSTKGCTSFGDFYWLQTYLFRHNVLGVSNPSMR